MTEPFHKPVSGDDVGLTHLLRPRKKFHIQTNSIRDSLAGVYDLTIPGHRGSDDILQFIRTQIINSILKTYRLHVIQSIEFTWQALTIYYNVSRCASVCSAENNYVL